MKFYDTMFVLKPTLTEEERNERIEFVQGVITKGGGEISATSEVGARELAYKIDKNDRGYYYSLYFKAPSNSILELERIYRINEDIIRFIVVKYEKKKEIAYWSKTVEDLNKKNAKQ
jgi:small subunit ribosomal protein S6